VIAHREGCDIYYEVFGRDADPTLLLINGLGSQCINYHEDWCAMFVDAGFRVVRFDNRDMGLSTRFDDQTYTLSDMALDTVAVIDAVRVDRAHVLGVSLGGMIAQTLTIEYPERVASLTSVMSNTGEPEYGQATPEAMAHLTTAAPPGRDGYIEHWVAGLRIWGSPGYADESWRRSIAARAYDRGHNPAGTVRQFFAGGMSGPRADGLRQVSTPTLVVHGDQDRLIDVSGGRRTAELVPNARFELIEGMGHDYPRELWATWVKLVADHALGARA
jgi:pimeloyl-ACP methyl ester carboxylesterase